MSGVEILAAGALGAGSAAITLADVGLALSAVSTVAGGISSRNQANAQAGIDRQRADREREIAKRDAAQFRDDQQRKLATRRALLGGSGVDIGTGSPLAVSEDFAGETEIQAQRITEGGQVRGTRLDQSADLLRRKGRSDLAGGFLRGGALLLNPKGK